MKCPICNRRTRKTCKHQAYIYDATFCTPLDGDLYEELNTFDDALSDRIDREAKQGGRIPPMKGAPWIVEVNALIKHLRNALQAHPPAHPDDAGVRVQMTRHYMRLFCYEILGNDCSIYMKEKDEEGGPGMSSSVFWYFTPDMDTLRAKVEQWTRHVQADDAEKSTCSTE